MISVIIPCYNAAEFIDRSIGSVLAQEYKDYEIILVNNNSTDGTPDMLRYYQEKYPETVRVFDELKKGGCAARNKGLKEAKGSWIQFLDADDELLPGKFTRQLALLEQNYGDFLSGNFIRIISVKGQKLKFTKGVNPSDPWSAIVAAKAGVTSANLFSRAMIEQIGGWDENLSSSQEYDMMFRLLVAGAKMIFDTRPSALIYYESNSISRSPNAQRNMALSDNYVNLRLRIQQYLEENNKLTIKRKRLIHKLIYAYIMDKKGVIPEYVEKKLKEMRLDVPFWEIFKVRCRIAGKHFIKRLSLK